MHASVLIIINEPVELSSLTHSKDNQFCLFTTKLRTSVLMRVILGLLFYFISLLLF